MPPIRWHYYWKMNNTVNVGFGLEFQNSRSWRKPRNTLPAPKVIYQYKEAEIEDAQKRLDHAFGLLFEATLKDINKN